MATLVGLFSSKEPTKPHRRRYRLAVEDSQAYAQRLSTLQDARWKRILDVQRPYRWNLQRLCTGRVLDIGCGIGRNLRNLRHLPVVPVGVDINTEAVALARSRGFEAFTVHEWQSSDAAVLGSFDTLLASHVWEHMDFEETNAVMASYLPYLAPGGRVVIECPQEVGYRSDHTHARWVDEREARRQCEALGLDVIRQFSYPFPRAFGKAFIYNQFETVATRR